MFDRVIYFGDSLTDNGQFYSLASQVFVTPVPYAPAGYDGQFSNGDVYSDIAPRLLGITQPDSVNFAVGSASALGSELFGTTNAPLVANPDPAVLNTDINLGGQIARFEAAAPGLGDLSNSAASFYIGYNDILGLDTTGLGPTEVLPAYQALSANIVTATMTAATATVQAGVGTIILNTFSPPALFPTFQNLTASEIAIADQVVQGHNQALITASASLTTAGATVKIVDLYSLGQEVLADASTFGFLFATEAIYLAAGGLPELIDPDGAGPLPAALGYPANPTVAGVDADQIGFIDALHPTTAMHGVMGAFSAATLEAGQTVFMGANLDRATFSANKDLVFSGDGNDILRSVDGDDVVFSGLGDDRVISGDGNDIVAGGSGNDRLHGTNGSDVIAGGAGNDRISGGNDNDAMIGGLGSDLVHGADGDDIFFYTEAGLIGGTTGADSDDYIGGKGNDTLYMVVSQAERAATDAVIAAGGGSADRYDFANLGLKTTSIENIVVLDSRADFDALVISTMPQDLIDEAEFWGLI